MFGRLTWKNVDDRSPGGGDWNTTQGDHFRRTEVRQIAASHNWVHGAFVNEMRGGWSNTVEKDSYTNAPQGADLVPAGGPGRASPARRPRAAFRTSSSRTARSSRPAASSRSTSSRASCRAATR